MDRFVKNFILMSMVYLAVASVYGVAMLARPELLAHRFIHSHLMLIGWVSMMIYGVGYHILPRFAGRLIRYKGMAEVQFWLANIGLVGMVAVYIPMMKTPGEGIYTFLGAAFGTMEAVSIFMFFFNMIATIYMPEPPKEKKEGH